MASLPKPPPPPRPKTRGSYNCGRCGLPKKGHVCAAGGPAPTPSPSSSSGAATTTTSGGGGGGGEGTKLRRALSFEDAATASASATPSSPEKKPRVVPDADAVGRGGEGEVEMVEGQGGEEELEEEEEAVELGGRAVPRELMAEVLRRLGPRGHGRRRGQPRLARLRGRCGARRRSCASAPLGSASSARCSRGAPRSRGSPCEWKGETPNESGSKTISFPRRSARIHGRISHRWLPRAL